MQQHFFSPDYASAQERFRADAARAGAELHTLPLSAKDPGGESLTLDIAWLGNRQPHKALVHVCGIHGVEGFAGAAVQLALLDSLPSLAGDCALVLVHVLNPYGMSHLRRANENNVDLNRNFFFGTAGWEGAPAGYATLDRFLNPPYPPARVSSFHIRLLLAELSLGESSIRQAVAGGQYDFPRGIFYGGSGLEEGPRRYGEWLGDRLKGVAELFVIDLHTGLGGYGEQSLFLRSETDADRLEASLGLPVSPDSRSRQSGVMGYEHEGGHSGIYRHLLPEAVAICLTQEFGTYEGRRLLRALRAENQHHHFGDDRLDHWSKIRLKAMFCPEDFHWRSQVVSRGVALVHRAAALLASGGVGQLARPL